MYTKSSASWLLNAFFGHNSFTVGLWLLTLVSKCRPIYQLSDGILTFDVRGKNNIDMTKNTKNRKQKPQSFK